MRRGAGFVLVAAALFLTACGGGSDDEPAAKVASGKRSSTTSSSTSTSTSTSVTTTSPSVTTRATTAPLPSTTTTAKPAGTTTTRPPTTTAPPVTTIPPQPQNHAISIKNFAFSPPALQIHVGDSVTAKNDDSPTHTWTADDGSFDSGNLATGATSSHTFTKAGTITYHCEIHSSMKGTIQVQ